MSVSPHKPHSMKWFCLLPFVFAIAARSAGAQAKTTVRVVSQAQPVRDAEVTIWTDSTRLWGGRSNSDGIVRLPASLSGSATLTVRRLGFVQRTLDITIGDSLDIELLPLASPLPALTVKARKSLACPLVDDPRAEALVRRAASRYGQHQDSLYFGYLGRWALEDVEPARRGYGNVQDGRRRMGMFTPPATVAPAWNLPLPYAVYEVNRWRYAPLSELSAWHFASETFRTLHTFLIVDSTAGVTTLRFCPRRVGTPDIEGEITIGPDTTFQGASYAFIVPHDDEDAGGEVTFGLGHFAGVPRLVPVRGSSWRLSAKSRYALTSFELYSWRFGRSATEVNTGWTPSGEGLHDPPSSP